MVVMPTPERGGKDKFAGSITVVALVAQTVFGECRKQEQRLKLWRPTKSMMRTCDRSMNGHRLDPTYKRAVFLVQEELPVHRVTLLRCSLE